MPPEASTETPTSPTPEAQTPPTNPSTPPASNTPEARTPEGEIKDAAPPAAPTEPKAETPPVPETYADFKAPEGFTLSPDLVAEVSPVFKDLGLNQDQAQKLVDWYAKAQLDQAKVMTDMRADWVSKVKADTEIGGKLDQVKVDIGRMFSHLEPALVSDFKSALDLTGAGDHPAVVKALYKLSQHINEGTHVTGGGPSPEGQTLNGKAPQRTLAQAMYPNLPSS